MTGALVVQADALRHACLAGKMVASECPGAVATARGVADQHLGRVVDMIQPTCSVDGCEDRAVALGWCNKHWLRMRRHGSLDDPTPSFEQRLWSRVARSDGCWLWLGSTGSEGYGKVRHQGQDLLVHRVVYELLVGPIPDGLTLDHLCRNRPCCRPEHLEPVTMAENIARGESPSAVNGRKVACKAGHPLEGSNLYTEPNGKRCCKECRRLRTRRYRGRT